MKDKNNLVGKDGAFLVSKVEDMGPCLSEDDAVEMIKNPRGTYKVGLDIIDAVYNEIEKNDAKFKSKDTVFSLHIMLANEKMNFLTTGLMPNHILLAYAMPPYRGGKRFDEIGSANIIFNIPPRIDGKK